MTKIISTAEKLFDFDAHQSRAEQSRVSLIAAEAVEVEKREAADQVAQRVRDAEDALGSGNVSAAALLNVRAEAERAAAIATTATDRREAAQGEVAGLNDDHAIADAVLAVLAPLVHGTSHVLSVPSPLPTAPDLADLRVVLAVVQRFPAERDDEGWLSTRHLEPVEVQIWHVKGLHVAPTRDEVFNAVDRSHSVSLKDGHAYQLSEIDEEFTTASGERVTKRSISLPIAAAAESPMTLSSPPDPARMSRYIEGVIRRVFAEHGDRGAAVKAGMAHMKGGGQKEVDLKVFTWHIEVEFFSRVGTQTEILEMVEDRIAVLVGRPIGGLGWVTDSRVTGRGIPDVLGSELWGWKNVMLSVETTARLAQLDL